MRCTHKPISDLLCAAVRPRLVGLDGGRLRQGDSGTISALPETTPIRPVFSFEPGSLDALIEQVADLAALKVRDDFWPKYMTKEIAGRYLSTSPKGIDNAGRAGKLERRWNGKEFIYARAELDHYAERLSGKKP